jgi:hypothetical protein
VPERLNNLTGVAIAVRSMRNLLLALLLAPCLLGGCTYFDTAEQAEGRCRKKGVGKLPPVSGEHAQATSAFLLSKYIDGCMMARGYRREASGKWTR